MRSIILSIISVFCCISMQAQILGSQPNPFQNYQEGQSDSISVSLVTYYPGSLEYELYGHAGIKIGFANGAGVFYNYGIFDFNSPNFTYRFVKGDAEYMVRGYSSEYMLRGYSRRKVVEQVLNFNQAQAYRAAAYLYENALPWNAKYIYNYVKDNCSTRPRDIIELATGGTIEYPAMKDTTTYRQMMHKYNANYAWSQFGIDMALGQGLDYTLNYREQMFVPMVLMEACAGATFLRDSIRVPLVKETIILNDGNEQGDILPPTPWWLTPLFVGVLVFALSLLLSWRDVKKKKVSRWFDMILYLSMSLYGMLLFFLIFVSMHEATSPNWNGVWINPFYLVPTVLMWIKSAKRVLYCYHFANFALLIAFIAGSLFLPQEFNIAFLPMIAILMLRSANYLIINKKSTTNK